MQTYFEALEILQEYIEEYQKLIVNSKINKYNSPLFLQYRSEIQDVIDFFNENKKEVPFSLYQEFQKVIQDLQENDQILLQILPEIKRFINLNHYRAKYPKDHWWWYS
ncbi:MAG: hypothetical protein N2169_00175 [bacterium]|nr:hypothetical protein [bacterium]